MSEFVIYENHGIIVKNPSGEYFPKSRRLRSFPSSASFQIAIDNYGDEFIYSIDHLRLQYQTMELLRNITFWRFRDNTCAFSYLTNRDDSRTRHFIKEPWELRSASRELQLQVTYVNLKKL